MEKILIGTITALLLLAFIPIKSATFNAADMTLANAELNNNTEEIQALLIQLGDSNEFNNSELMLAENKETENKIIEKKQETGTSDRGAFIFVGSMVMIGILLLLPPLKTI